MTCKQIITGYVKANNYWTYVNKQLHDMICKQTITGSGQAICSMICKQTITGRM